MLKNRSIFKAHQIERREMSILQSEFAESRRENAQTGELPAAAFLDSSRIAERLRLYQLRELGASLDLSIDEVPQIIIRCRKTGTPVCTLPQEIAQQAHAYCNARDIETYTNNFTHPAWLNTSPERLRRLQLDMPHEFAVYSFCMLSRNNANASARGAMLDALHWNWEVADVIEFAELLRRALAMFGRHEVAGNAIAFHIGTDSPATCMAELRAWITAWIKVMQRKFHQYDSDRQRVVTLTDVKNFTLDLGVSAFRLARGNDESGMLMLADMAEIFGSDIGAEFRAAVSYTAPEKPATKTKYAGVAAPVNFDAAFTALFTAQNAADSSAPNTPAPAALAAPRMKLGTRSNATISINLFGDK